MLKFDLNGVFVMVRIDVSVVYLFNENVKFWVVVFCISFFEVLGFNIFLFGSYIVMLVYDKGKE